MNVFEYLPYNGSSLSLMRHQNGRTSRDIHLSQCSIQWFCLSIQLNVIVYLWYDNDTQPEDIFQHIRNKAIIFVM